MRIPSQIGLAAAIVASCATVHERIPRCALDTTEVAVLSAATAEAPCYGQRGTPTHYYFDPFSQTEHFGAPIAAADSLEWLRGADLLSGWPYHGAFSDLAARNCSPCRIPLDLHLASALGTPISTAATDWPVYGPAQETDPSLCGLVGFSRIGFNADRTRAIVYLVLYRRFNVATGHIVLLRLEKDGWVVDQFEMIWLS